MYRTGSSPSKAPGGLLDFLAAISGGTAVAGSFTDDVGKRQLQAWWGHSARSRVSLKVAR